jgi:tetratricopeptide (TPR) repeat protein
MRREISNCQLHIANCKLDDNLVPTLRRGNVGDTGSLLSHKTRNVENNAFPRRRVGTRKPRLFNLQFAVCILQFAMLLLLPGCAPRADLGAAQKFEAAQKAFDAAVGPDDFQRAAARYQEIVDSGIRSGAVYYDLGNAWMRAKQPGRAIVAYRQAQRYLPRSRDLQENLRNALGRNDVAPHESLWETIFFWQNWLSYPEKFYAAAAAVCLTFLGGVAVLLFPRRRIWKRLALAGIALSLLLIASAAYDWYRFDYLVHGVVVQSEVTARKGNGENYAPAFNEKLAEGTEFRVEERRGDWLLIRLSGGQEGWIPDKTAVTY